MQPEHLEISADFSADGTLALAQKELKKINMFKVWSVECVWGERKEEPNPPHRPWQAWGWGGWNVYISLVMPP